MTLFTAVQARAEKVIFKGDDWEVYTDGRMGGFVSWTYGDGYPQNTYGPAPYFATVTTVQGGGWQGPSENKYLYPDGGMAGGSTLTDQGTINMMRVRSGFVSNVLGFGVRNKLTPTTTVTAYTQIWAYIESQSRQKNQPNPADLRQGYAKIDAPWGSVTIGRTRALFSRGATDIDVMYAHRWGVGMPAPLDSNGPTPGQIGFGVLGSGFAGGVIYGTPTFAGLQLNAGIFEPIALPAGGSWLRTKYLRPEGELTFEQALGTLGKIVLFTNGGFQKVYKPGACIPGSVSNPGPCDATAAGFGYGGRLELGPVHLGVAGHRGKGLGLTYALESTPASSDSQGNLRVADGYYAQTQFVLGQVNLSAGAGIARVFLTTKDKTKVVDPSDPTGVNMVYPVSVIKYQMGINAGVVYHLSPAVHLDLDYFRATAKWYLGEQQIINAVNGGMMVSW